MAYQEYTYRPTRTVGGKKIRARLYVGQYFFDGMVEPERVGLNTPDKSTADARLRAIITREQRRMEGLLPAKELATAGRRKIAEHLADYEADLKAQERDRKHIKDTCRRVARIIRENSWKGLADMTGAAFTTWRAGFKGSAKTKKEYQVSINAFANWLVRQARLEKNPFLGVSRVETRGKQERVARPLTVEEFQRLVEVAGPRTVVYQTLVYTAQRMIEVYRLRWCDLRLEGDCPTAHFRQRTTKDKADRWVPLPLPLAAKLRALRLPSFARERRVFWHLFPVAETFHADLKAAGIPRRSGDGEVVHFHSFRKCLGSWAVDYGIAQKATQEVLGHSDANLTANIYSRISAVLAATKTSMTRSKDIEAMLTPETAHQLAEPSATDAKPKSEAEGKDFSAPNGMNVFSDLAIEIVSFKPSSDSSVLVLLKATNRNASYPIKIGLNSNNAGQRGTFLLDDQGNSYTEQKNQHPHFGGCFF